MWEIKCVLRDQTLDSSDQAGMLMGQKKNLRQITVKFRVGINLRRVPRKHEFGAGSFAWVWGA